MFGRPQTVSRAVKALLITINDLERVKEEQARKSAQHKAESEIAQTASEVAKSEAEKANRIAEKLREIIEE